MLLDLTNFHVVIDPASYPGTLSVRARARTDKPDEGVVRFEQRLDGQKVPVGMPYKVYENGLLDFFIHPPEFTAPGRALYYEAYVPYEADDLQAAGMHTYQLILVRKEPYKWWVSFNTLRSPTTTILLPDYIEWSQSSTVAWTHIKEPRI